MCTYCCELARATAEHCCRCCSASGACPVAQCVVHKHLPVMSDSFVLQTRSCSPDLLQHSGLLASEHTDPSHCCRIAAARGASAAQPSAAPTTAAPPPPQPQQRPPPAIDAPAPRAAPQPTAPPQTGWQTGSGAGGAARPRHSRWDAKPVAADIHAVGQRSAAPHDAGSTGGWGRAAHQEAVRPSPPPGDAPAPSAHGPAQPPAASAHQRAGQAGGFHAAPAGMMLHAAEQPPLPPDPPPPPDGGPLQGSGTLWHRPAVPSRRSSQSVAQRGWQSSATAPSAAGLGFSMSASAAAPAGPQQAAREGAGASAAAPQASGAGGGSAKAPKGRMASMFGGSDDED